jgi:hypothetical protein
MVKIKTKKREIVCPHSDCTFYSSENVTLDGEAMLITYCSHPNNDLVEDAKSCNFFRVNWARQAQRIRKSDPAEKVKLQRQAIVKLMQHAVGNLSAEEKDAALGLIEQLKEQEERLSKLSDILKTNETIAAEDPFVVGNAGAEESGEESPEDVVRAAMEALGAPQDFGAAKATPAPPKEETPEDVVRTFIESWNKQDFDKEYKCLGKKLRMVPHMDYVKSRHYTYAEMANQSSDGSLPTQHLGDILSSRNDGTTARIICNKIDKSGATEKLYQQRYILEKEENAWKIVEVQTREK